MAGPGERDLGSKEAKVVHEVQMRQLAGFFDLIYGILTTPDAIESLHPQGRIVIPQILDFKLPTSTPGLDITFGQLLEYYSRTLNPDYSKPLSRNGANLDPTLGSFVSIGSPGELDGWELSFGAQASRAKAEGRELSFANIQIAAVKRIPGQPLLFGPNIVVDLQRNVKDYSGFARQPEDLNRFREDGRDTASLGRFIAEYAGQKVEVVGNRGRRFTVPKLQVAMFISQGPISDQPGMRPHFLGAISTENFRFEDADFPGGYRDLRIRPEEFLSGYRTIVEMAREAIEDTQEEERPHRRGL